MRRIALPLSILFGLSGASIACRDNSGTLPPDDTDAGVAFPDARVIRPPDSGITEVETPPPTLTGVSPRSGPETGGTRVTLRGSSFVEPAEVFFGEAPATSVVVLDEVSIAATTPPGAVGAALVRVATPGGIAELPGAFTYHRELRLTAVEPARIPDEGGVWVTVTGKGFDDSTLVLFERQPLRGQVVVDAERIEGYAPALLAGRPEVRVINRDAAVRRSDVVVVFATPDVTSLAPGYGPIAGGARQDVDGEGLTGATEVRVGGARADMTLGSDTRLVFVAPPQSEGAHDVVVDNGDAAGTLANGYVAFDPNRNELAILGVTPPRVSSEGGQVVTIVGRGFGPDAQVVLQGARLPTESIRFNAIQIVVPAGLPVGAQDVTVISGGVSVTAAGALTVFAPIQVMAISPASGPVTGGTAVTITGLGFAAGAEVRIANVQLADVVVVSDTQITGTTVAGAHGAHDVVVRSADTRGVLVDGFSFEEAFDVIRVEPSQGSIAGNTYVSIIGRGLSEPVAVSFGGVVGLEPVLENGAVIGVRTQPSPTGLVDVEVSTGGGDVTLPRAFQFYDPRLITGGAWGGAIEGSVNVAVMSFQGEPLPNMLVQLGYDADLRYTGLTDQNGLATISSPEIRGAQTVTAGAPGVEFVTMMELNAANVTLVASPHPTSMPPDAPVQPCPTPVAAPLVRGQIFKFKSSLDPVTRPDWIPAARITYTDRNVFNANPAEPPEQVAWVFQEGGTYEIVVMRAGTVAVFATLGDLNVVTGEFQPRRMGITRSVPVAPETITENINIALDIELNQTTRIRLDAPPDQVPGPTLNAVFPFLNLASDGVIPFPASAVVGSGTVILNNLPAIAESEFFYMGGSFTQGAQGLQAPYSLTLLESAANFEDGIDLGPFVQMPQNVTPKPNQVLVNGRMSWTQGGPTPNITTISVVDVVGVSGCCCMDANRNGQCEATEGLQCGGLPQQFNRWSVYGQGGLQSYVMPRMPLGLQAFEPPRTYAWLVQQAIAPRFNYNEFVYNQFSPFFWKSWSVWFSQFVVKEETD